MLKKDWRLDKYIKVNFKSLSSNHKQVNNYD